MKIFIMLFSVTVKCRQLKLSTHLDSGWMHHGLNNEVTVYFVTIYLHFIYPCMRSCIRVVLFLSFT